MDGTDNLDNYAAAMTVVTEGEWAGWSCYPGGDPFEDLTGPFYCRVDEQGRPVCLFWIARDVIAGVRSVTATFNCELVGTAREGDLVECVGEVVKAGRSMVFLRGIISTGGEPMMSFSSVLKKTAHRT